MRVALSGLPFDTDSPSFYAFAPELLEGHTLDIAYLGDADASDMPQWCLFHGYPDGGIECQMFDTRDAALRFLVQGLKPG